MSKYYYLYSTCQLSTHLSLCHTNCNVTSSCPPIKLPRHNLRASAFYWKSSNITTSNEFSFLILCRRGFCHYTMYLHSDSILNNNFNLPLSKPLQFEPSFKSVFISWSDNFCSWRGSEWFHAWISSYVQASVALGRAYLSIYSIYSIADCCATKIIDKESQKIAC